MLEEMYDKLDDFRSNIIEPLDEKLLRSKEQDCGVNFPADMFDFYKRFGNDEKVLSAYYLFDKIEDIEVADGALQFGYTHQHSGRLGIKLEEIGSRLQSVSWCPYYEEEWFVEGMYSKSFFFNVACWQVLNTMPSVARVRLKEKEFEALVRKHFHYFSDEKVIMKGYKIISIYSEEILGCYAKLDGILYLGTQKGDEILEACEEKFNLDLDWL